MDGPGQRCYPEMWNRTRPLATRAALQNSTVLPDFDQKGDSSAKLDNLPNERDKLDYLDARV
jgi:hypothetical protein